MIIIVVDGSSLNIRSTKSIGAQVRDRVKNPNSTPFVRFVLSLQHDGVPLSVFIYGKDNFFGPPIFSSTWVWSPGLI